MVVTKPLTRNTDLVVIGSEDLDTATVQKAREAGVEIIVESTPWLRLGEMLWSELGPLACAAAAR